ncbi:glycerophosphodiester phosphodiesterase family protein [Kordiimonas aestuarii]|uniref:glycerophosphodiester phosphodiesterase family protein n=1 Tax=Kordiimonas aestuarii TaxID=1005925 RepID=UPI0021D183F7|nr:glycerophosphodiester phosphodiesterase family protein [Kordiimonas aestuarii]
MANNQRHFPWLTEHDIAHRGLFEAGTSTEENTLASVHAAVKAGYAVEIDVRATVDDIIVVFHDELLDRMTNGKGAVATWGFKQLREEFIVGKSGQPMPSLPDVLDEVDSERPLFVEIKSSRHKSPQKLCAGVRHAFEGYGGPVAIMSFDPRVVNWFKTYMPKYPRGLVVGREFLLSVKRRLALQLWVHKCKPDFIACDVNLLPNSFCTSWRKKGKPLLTWTVRDQKMETIAREHADAMIFEKPAVIGDQA